MGQTLGNIASTLGERPRGPKFCGWLYGKAQPRPVDHHAHAAKRGQVVLSERKHTEVEPAAGGYTERLRRRVGLSSASVTRRAHGRVSMADRVVGNRRLRWFSIDSRNRARTNQSVFVARTVWT